jgi:AraC-like DNA-binding protein
VPWPKGPKHRGSVVPFNMCRSATYTFADPVPYGAAIRGTDVEILIAAKGDFRSKLIQMFFEHLWTHFGCESLPRIIHSGLNTRRTFIAFLADGQQPAAYYSGLEVSSNALAVSGGGSSRHIRTWGVSRWVGMSLPEDVLTAVSRALVGRELRAKQDTRLVCPSPAHMARLVRLHAAARHLAETAPEIFAQPEASRALEHELVHAMVNCLADGTRPEAILAWRRHSAIVKRFEQVLAEADDRPMHLAQICAAVGASERTLRNSCKEHLGMGPIRYLWLRRMHQARRALIRTDPGKSTVAQVATQYGFWDWGRFAMAYRALFGESPSASLRRVTH